jgi:hypothetical protein
MNHCLVKYIHLKDIDPDTLHSNIDYELSKTHVSHSSYEEMEQRVDENCPRGFVCRRPIALHHEVLWRMMLRANGKNTIEVDELFQPIDCVDYTAIQWSTSNTDHPMLSVCVHVEPNLSIME